MSGREPDEDPLPSPTIPLRNLLAILKARAEHINGASEDMITGKTRAG
jgi:hypothetical protein